MAAKKVKSRSKPVKKTIKKVVTKKAIQKKAAPKRAAPRKVVSRKPIQKSPTVALSANPMINSVDDKSLDGTQNTTAAETSFQSTTQNSVQEPSTKVNKIDPNAAPLGVVGVIIGLAGLFFPSPLNIIAGVITGILATYALKHNHKVLALVGGILAVIDILFFILLL